MRPAIDTCVDRRAPLVPMASLMTCTVSVWPSKTWRSMGTGGASARAHAKAVDGRVVVEGADRGGHAGLRCLALELDEAGIDAYVERQARIDPDLWLIEIDDAEGRHFLTEQVVHFQRDNRLHGQIELNRRDRVEGVRIVLMQCIVLWHQIHRRIF